MSYLINRDFIAKTVAEHGLTFFGLTDLNVKQAHQRYRDWLDGGKNAGMAYMAENADVREDPTKILAGAKSAVIIGLDYFLGDKLNDKDQAPKPAQYARLKDYHKVLKIKGGAILAKLLEQTGNSHAGRVVVDSAPVLERALAAKTASGFIGKNTLFIHPEKGSYFLLAEIFLTLEVPFDETPPVDPEKRSAAGGCGTCQRCQVHCPTGALDTPYVLDANKCLSYWTIENRGTIPFKFWPWLSRYYFGCDICQLACPYNKGLEPNASVSSLHVKSLPKLTDVASMSQAEYEAWFGGTPLTRAKRDGLRRNAIIALCVTKHPELDSILAKIDESHSELIRSTANQVIEWQKLNDATHH